MHIAKLLIVIGFIVSSRMHCGDFISHIMVIAGDNIQQHLIQVNNATTIGDIKKRLKDDYGYPMSFQILHAIEGMSNNTTAVESYSCPLRNECMVRACMMYYKAVRFKLDLVMPPLAAHAILPITQ